MDLRHLGRAFARFWPIVGLGLLVAVVLATLSYYSVSFRGGKPELTPSREEVWQASAIAFLTKPGFPAGGIRSSDSAGRLTGLAPLYARLANSDAVKQLMLRRGGPLNGTFTAIPTADTNYGTVNGLPMITILGSASDAKGAVRLAKRGTNAFIRYVEARQAKAKIGDRQRIKIEVLNASGKPLLVVPRKKTLPIVVFLAVLFVAIALVIILDNVRPYRRTVLESKHEAGAITSTAEDHLRRLA